MISLKSYAAGIDQQVLSGQRGHQPFLYHAGSNALPWQGVNGNAIHNNTVDAATTAYLADVWYAPTSTYTHKVYSLPQFQASAPSLVYGNQ